MRRFISRPMRRSQRQEDQLGFISTSTTENDPTPALTAYRLISSTITTCCHYPWQPETIQESTYKSGLAVQTTGATSFIPRDFNFNNTSRQFWVDSLIPSSIARKCFSPRSFTADYHQGAQLVCSALRPL
jgi:hypothetical protein